MELFKTLKPARIIAGIGLQRISNGGETIRAISLIPAITGNIGISGGGWNYANLQSSFDLNLLLPDPPKRIRKPIPIGLLVSELTEVKDPALQMAWINPLTFNPNVNKLKVAMAKLDFIVVVDQFITDTAKYADLVLPTKTMFEQTDVVLSYWHSYIQIRDKVIESYEDTRPETWIYRKLIERMGYDTSWIPEDTEKLLDKHLNKYGLSLDQLREKPILARWVSFIAFEDYKFPTISGKIELTSIEAEERWGLTSVPHYNPPKGVKTNLRYPLHLITIHPKERIHSQFRYNQRLNTVNQGPTLRMNLDDAEIRGLKDEDRVVIFNAHGEVRAKLKISEKVRPGVVIMEEGWWENEGGSPDLLIKDRLTDLGYGTAFNDCFVEVK